MPVYEAPPDPDDHDDGYGDDGGDVDGGRGGGAGDRSGAAGNDESGDVGAPRPRQSYNFAPGYHGIVYRADVPDWGAGPRRRHRRHSAGADADADAATNAATNAGDKDEDDDDNEPHSEEKGGGKEEVHYKLQAMKWGLVPFWTKRKDSNYSSLMKTINCRDDSLAQPGGMWSSMKARKRCVVVAQGFYEWLKKGNEKVPHFVKRRDGRLMCFAGLWDVVLFESKLGALFSSPPFRFSFFLEHAQQVGNVLYLPAVAWVC